MKTHPRAKSEYYECVRNQIVQVDLLVPIYNDSSKLDNFFEKFTAVRTELAPSVELKLILVDDGSGDSSLERIIELARIHKQVAIIELSRNFGKEAALFAGISFSCADALILIDVDLQDPIDLIPRMIDVWINTNCDSVVARRSQSKGSENGIRRKISRLYLRVFNKLSSVQIDRNVGETRLINSKMIESFKLLDESTRFTRGLLQWLGFKTEYIDFNRKVSPEKSRFGAGKLVKLAIDGITSFSIMPLRLVAAFGFIGGFLSIFLGITVIFLRLFNVVSIPGYSSTILVILFGSSIQLFCMGILGEYVGKNLEESKNRPVFIARNIYKY
jgi:glycosyltransferase involved in cell wall biosynthesis